MSIINKGLTINGTVACKGRLIINGTVKGTVVGETVVIGQGGAVYTDTTKAAYVEIAGIFEGEVRASKDLIIKSTGKCSGKVVYKKIVVEAGAVLNAAVNCLSISEFDSVKELPAPEKKNKQADARDQQADHQPSK
jgi:cytoskeletal protein CcmA (bactofilin family)